MKVDTGDGPEPVYFREDANAPGHVFNDQNMTMVSSFTRTPRGHWWADRMLACRSNRLQKVIPIVQPKVHAIFGAASAGLAASILAVDLPYYAIGATAVLLGLLIVWLTLAIRQRKTRKQTPQT
ncbi:hypothetical protein [Marinactinospora rubrisoli]|uniref:Uncharacterized protein n=1 Tax=Marinactinospora rubrisoli TaxID=2715399 RepID=A0ABW2KII8_9ACTN